MTVLWSLLGAIGLIGLAWWLHHCHQQQAEVSAPDLVERLQAIGWPIKRSS